MTIKAELPPETRTGEPTDSKLPDSLPQGSEIQQVSPSLEILLIPATDFEDPAPLATAREWVNAVGTEGVGQALLLSLHGAQLVWSPDRAAVIAAADRLGSVRLALVEFAVHDAELREIERQIGEGWPHLEADSWLAFDFHEKAVGRRPELARRFQQALALRARLARLTPHVHRPPIHPPTLASQIGERLRERTRLADRVEFISGQLEVFERVYEMCSQRASEFMLSRTGHNLEWVIIVLLAAQTLLLVVERLATLGI